MLPHLRAMVIFIENFFFEKTNNQKQNKKNKTKKCHFPALPILNIFSQKISGIGPWVSRID
jgi:hypothetical protein